MPVAGFEYFVHRLPMIIVCLNRPMTPGAECGEEPIRLSDGFEGFYLLMAPIDDLSSL
jgi:hypothetical protein